MNQRLGAVSRYYALADSKMGNFIKDIAFRYANYLISLRTHLQGRPILLIS